MNGEGTVGYVASEKRYIAHYPADSKRRTIASKIRRDAGFKLSNALSKLKRMKVTGSFVTPKSLQCITHDLNVKMGDIVTSSVARMTSKRP